MNLPRLIKTFTDSEIFKFAVVGTIGFCVDSGSYMIMTRFFGFRNVFCWGLNGQSSYFTTLAARPGDSCNEGSFILIGATFVSVFLAIISNFLLNKYWTFHKTAGNSDVAKQGIGYFAYNLFTYALNQGLVAYFVANLGILRVLPNYVDLSAKILAVIIVLFFNFFGSKFLIFRKQPEKIVA